MAIKLDLEWDDADALPSVFHPDTRFLFDRMTEATLDMIDLTRGRRVLDVACGMGIDAAALIRRGGSVVGLEASRIMIQKARRWNGGKVPLIRGIAESLPLKPNLFDYTVCKGAIDHFYDPDRAVSQMAQVIKPDGRVIISVTNFESLGCKLARSLAMAWEFLAKREVQGRCRWEIPPDHTYKFDYFVLRHLLQKHFEIETLLGVSLGWGFPRWGQFLERLPERISLSILVVLDKIAKRFPIFSDVLVARCRVPQKREVKA